MSWEGEGGGEWRYVNVVMEPPVAMEPSIRRLRALSTEVCLALPCFLLFAVR